MENCINKFTMVLNKHAPLWKSTRKKKRLAAKPWITKGILTSIKIKNKMYKELLTNNTTQQKTIFKLILKSKPKSYILINKSRNHSTILGFYGKQLMI